MKRLGILGWGIAALLAFTVSVHAAEALSPALRVLQEDCTVVKTGVGTNSVSFTREDFLSVFGEDEILGIVVTRLPDADDGVLKLGSAAVSVGQIVSAEALPALRFLPAAAGKTASFGFLPYGRAYEKDFVCTVYMLDALNFAPVAAALSLSAVENVPVYASLCARDPDGDAVSYRLVEGPENGTLTLNEDGTYCYLPSGAAQDRFTYVAEDPYGNCSEPSTVVIRTAKNNSGIVYADVGDERGAMPAVMLAEKSAFVGERVGNEWYFHPEKTVTRGEFLMMAMRMNGIETELLAADRSGFADSASFTAAENKYIATAARLGLVVGIETDEGRCFCPDDAITAAQASTIVSRIARLNGASFASAVLASADPEDELSDEGMAMLREIGVACGEERDARLTRADAAALLYTLSLTE